MRYLWKIFTESAGHIRRVLADNFQSLNVPWGILSAMLWVLRSARGSHATFLEGVSRFLIETFQFWGRSLWSLTFQPILPGGSDK